MGAASKSVLIVWLLLMLSTAASIWGFSRPTIAATVSSIAVIAIAAIKVGLVMSHFMELRNAPWAWRLAGTIWVIATTSTLVVAYLL